MRTLTCDAIGFFMREFVAGRPNQCRPQETLPPQSEKAGSQYVGPIVAGSVRQQHDLELERLRRRIGSKTAFW